MQVAEHPALGALREGLMAMGIRPVTVENGKPTPILVRGAERRCQVSTDPTQDRRHGLYGNAFGRADPDAVRRATTRLDSPTVTNVIAMAAPRGGSGRYAREEIGNILLTAYTGFRAAAIESAEQPTVVHTGFWGCGAFGGNRILMAALQVLAAGMAELERIVFYTGQPGGESSVNAAIRLLQDDLAHSGSQATDDLIAQITARGFEWGVGDGN